MKAIIGANIHNKFEFELRDAVTGELKQSHTTYNIVLNNMFNRLCSMASFCTHIQIGTGTGTMDPARTSLFSFAKATAITTDAKEMSYPVSYWRTKIIINPEECVGLDITEVGVAYGSGATGVLVTHSLLKDSEGNPIVIHKTSADVLIIYATIYSNLTMPSGMHLTNISDNKNALLLYLTGTTYSTTAARYVQAGYAGLKADTPISAGTLSKYRANTDSSSLSLHPPVADTTNRKVKFGPVRFGISAGNGNLKEIGVSTLFNMSVSNDNFSPVVYTDVPIAVGDGTKTSFKLPSLNTVSNTVDVKINGVSVAHTLRRASVPVTMAVPAFYNDTYCLTKDCSTMYYNKDDGGYQSARIVWSDKKGNYVPDTYSPSQSGNKYFGYNWPFFADADGNLITVLNVATNTGSRFSLVKAAKRTTDNRVGLLEDMLAAEATSFTGSSSRDNLNYFAIDHLNRYFFTCNTDTFTYMHVNEDGKLMNATCPIPIVQTNKSNYRLVCVGDYLLVAFTNTYSTVTEHIAMYKYVNGEFIKCTITCAMPSALLKGVYLCSDGVSVFGPVSATENYVYVVDTVNDDLKAYPLPTNGVSSVTAFDIDPTSSYAVMGGTYTSTVTDAGNIPRFFNLDKNTYTFTEIDCEDFYPFYAASVPASLPSSRAITKLVARKDTLGNPIVYVNNTCMYALNMCWRDVIDFAVAPSSGDIITATYSVDGIHKTDQYVMDVSAEITFGGTQA